MDIGGFNQSEANVHLFSKKKGPGDKDHQNSDPPVY